MTEKKPQGWYLDNACGWYLTKRAVLREFKITEEQFSLLMHSWQGSKIKTHPIYPRIRSSFVELAYCLDDLKIQMQCT